MTPPSGHSSPLDIKIRKRVCKACDRCRLKKSKCNGASPCSRCRADNAICVLGERKNSHDKVYPKGYVEMLKSQQEQLVAGLQELYKRMQNGLGWIGSPLEETSNGVPLTHDILERLGVLEPDVFEEDLTALQQRLTADGARFTQEQPSHDLHSDSVLSSIHKPVAQRPNVSNAFSLGLFLPTPPDQSHFPQNAQVIPPTTYSHIFPFSTITDLSLRWNTADDSIDFMNQFETSVMDSAMESDSFTQATLQEQFLLARINPCLTMEDPVGGEELQPYFNPTLV